MRAEGGGVWSKNKRKVRDFERRPNASWLRISGISQEWIVKKD